MRVVDDVVRVVRLLALVWLLCAGAILMPAIQAALLFGQGGAAGSFLWLLAPPAMLWLAAAALARRWRRA